jgi:hypothetical protein
LRTREAAPDRSTTNAKDDTMTDSATQITNLLGRYAECIDTGNLPGAADLFRRARIRVSSAATGAVDDGTVDADGVLRLWNDLIVMYADGTPRTKHVITNPIIEVDEDAGTATCRSYYTVTQQCDDFPLQVICTGRYHDAFERADDGWHYSFRDYSLIDQVGDMSHHIRHAVVTDSGA